MGKKQFDKLVNDKGNIPILVLVLEDQGEDFVPKIVANETALKNERIRGAVGGALNRWLDKLEPVG